MSALDSSVTLEDVFAVVGNRRVPLAPELAGYLVLEIAEHADPAGGDVDPRSVFVGDEGTVALVKPKRDSITGDAETSIRAALARLLEASGSQTPALAAASKRRSGAGLPTLAEELEAALIPVNRAAGRRALARLAREVKRVTLGVGRNAMPSSSDAAPSARRPSSPAHPAPSTPPPPVAALAPSSPPPAVGRAPSFSKEEEPTTARGQIPDEVLKKATPPPTDVKQASRPPPGASPRPPEVKPGPLARPKTDPLGRPQTDADIEASELPTMEFVPPGRGPSASQADVDALIADFGVSGGGDQHARAELKKIAGLEPTPPPPHALAPEIMKRLETREVDLDQDRGRDSGISGLLALGDEPPPAPAAIAAPTTRPSPVPPMRAPAPSLSSERQLPTQPSKLKKSRASLPSVPTQSAGRRASLGWLVALLVIGAGGYALWQMRSVLFGARPPAPAPSAASGAGSQAPAPCNQVLVVTDVPPHAEVLLRKGQAPVDVEKMPVGARLEFVATAEGFAPKRVVVPLGAAWDNGPDGKPRYEAGVQLDKSKAPHGTNDPWPAGEPGSAVGGQGPPGTVHVVATPRGAEVWMLAGLGPEARIEQQLACDEDVEVLVAGPTTFRKRLHVAASDFVPEDTPPPGQAPAPPGSAPPGKQPPKRVARVSGK